VVEIDKNKLCRWNWQRETATLEVWQEVKGKVARTIKLSEPAIEMLFL
jgi:hypothetical protein